MRHNVPSTEASAKKNKLKTNRHSATQCGMTVFFVEMEKAFAKILSYHTSIFL